MDEGQGVVPADELGLQDPAEGEGEKGRVRGGLVEGGGGGGAGPIGGGGGRAAGVPVGCVKGQGRGTHTGKKKKRSDGLKKRHKKDTTYLASPAPAAAAEKERRLLLLLLLLLRLAMVEVVPALFMMGMAESCVLICIFIYI